MSSIFIATPQKRPRRIILAGFFATIKYGDGRKVTLNLQKEDNCLLLAVENTGIAVSPNESTHVFESFWRGSNALDKPGNGLGLYICKHIMRKMNGDIFIFNICGGMCFVVVIPIA